MMQSLNNKTVSVPAKTTAQPAQPQTFKTEASLTKEKVRLIVQKKFSEMRSLYEESKSEYVRFYVQGDYGTGKTQLLSTCPMPVYIHSFDPGGSKTKALQPYIDKGLVIVDRRFEKEDWKSPKSFALWEREMKSMIASGIFDYIGTYALDSMTLWARYALYDIARRGIGRGVVPHPGQEFYQSDYMWQQLILGDWLVKEIFSLPCHVVCTAHVQVTKDDVTGALIASPMMWGKVADQLPLLFDEKYVMRVTGKDHKLQLKNDGFYKAETRMLGSTAEAKVEPNIKKLLQKAGLSWKDKDVTDIISEGNNDRYEDLTEQSTEIESEGDNFSESDSTSGTE